MRIKRTKTTKVKVLLVDDHPVLRRGLAQTINSESDIMVCGEAEDAVQAWEGIKMWKPDLLIVDISLKEANGLELVKSIHAQFPELLILILSMHDESLYAERALHAGAKGYIMKQEAPEKIIDAIRKVKEGGIFISDAIGKRMLHAAVGNPMPRNSPLERLSNRELEVFQLIGEGYGTVEIAEKLRLGGKTVETYRAHIKEKMNLNNAMALIRSAVSFQGPVRKIQDVNFISTLKSQ